MQITFIMPNIRAMHPLQKVIWIFVISCLNTVVSIVSKCPEVADHWSGWWGYDGGISGPQQWGEHNSEWIICRTGKNQSPINIQPETLLYDPHLKPLQIETTLVNGILWNTKKDLTFIINTTGTYMNISSGPLSYKYVLYQIKIHYGRRDDTPGSEHTIDGNSFPGEIHFMAYNAELYTNYTEAQYSPRGIAIVAVFLSVSEKENSAFNTFRKQFSSVKKRDTCTEVSGLLIDELLPKTDQYMTYSGSLTQPGCKETVTWILYNKPAYISHKQISELRLVPDQEWLRSNTRPVMPLNHRTVRTNINFRKRTKLCSMEVSKSYEMNPHIPK